MRRAAVLTAVALTGAPLLGAQTDTRSRLEGRVPPAIVVVVDSIIADATAHALPAEALIQKALEGGAKGVAGDRIVAAVQLLSARLATAAEAIDAAGAGRSAAAIEAGAFALTAGLQPDDVRTLAGAAPDAVSVLRVAGTLSAIGVPRGETVALVVSTAQREGGDLTTLPQAVQAAMTRGASPAQAARLAQGGAGDRGAQPHGPPPDRPTRPKPKRP